MLTTENIDYIKTSKVFDFKYGRIITDERNFYSIFLRDDLGYQIQIEFDNQDNTIKTLELLTELNKLDEIPNMIKFMDIFHQLILMK